MAFLVHITQSGERWDLLAYRYYGDAARQDVLLRANRSLYLSPLRVPPLVLAAGLRLIIPILDIDAPDVSALPPWKRPA